MRIIKRINVPLTHELQQKPYLRVAAYCRVSTDNVGQAESLSFHEHYYEKLIRNNINWRLVSIYVDCATGRNRVKRPQFNKMILDCSDGKIDLIITKSISRFGRNTVEVLKVCKELKVMGVDVYFEIEKINLFKQHSDLMLTIFASLYQNESEEKSFNIKWGIQRSFEKLYSKYYIRVCYGYEKGETNALIIKEDEAEIIRVIYNLYLEGNSLRQIIKELQKHEILSPRGNKKWSAECITKILSNEKYTGNIILGKTYVKNFFDGKQVKNTGQEKRFFISNSHPAIISKSSFDEVQQEKIRR